METFLTKTTDETQRIGEEFASRIASGGVAVLYGNLGAGKTTFVQGLAKGLGIEKRIISPTFVILRTYMLPSIIANHEALKQPQSESGLPREQSSLAMTEGNFYHIDLYRLQATKHELEEIGLLDLLTNPHNIFAIEWPEKMRELLPKNRWEVWFENIDEDKRKISINKVS